MKRAREGGTLVLLENLDPSYTLSEIKVYFADNPTTNLKYILMELVFFFFSNLEIENSCLPANLRVPLTSRLNACVLVKLFLVRKLPKL